MKLSKSMLNTLKSFSIINKSIYFDEPFFMKITTDSGNITAVARIEEELPVFGIFDIAKFAAIVNDDNADFNFKDDHVIIKQGKTNISYKYLDKNHIYTKIKPAENYLTYNDFDGNCHLNKDDIRQIVTTSKILNLDTVKFNLDENMIACYSSTNPLADKFDIEIEANGKGNVNMSIDNFIMISGDYDVFVGNKCIKFTTGNINYFIAPKK